MNSSGAWFAAGIDWLSITIPWSDNQLVSMFADAEGNLLKFASHMLQMDKVRWSRPLPINPIKGYITGYKHPEFGHMVYISKEGSPTGVHLVFPGSVCTSLGGLDILSGISSRHPTMHVSRIDLAVDIFNGGCTPSEVYKDMEAGLIDTKARSYSLITSNEGETCYIGKRTSEKMMRIYDKGAQTGDHENWVRFELEVKGASAKGVGRALIETGFGDDSIYELESMIAVVMQSFMDYQHETFVNAMETIDAGYAVSLPTEEKKRDSWWWVEKSVLPTLKRLMAEDEDRYLEMMSVLNPKKPEHSSVKGVGQPVNHFDEMEKLVELEDQEEIPF